MNSKSAHIDYDKIARYLAGESEIREQQELEFWINASDENQKVFDECRQLLAYDYARLPEVSRTFDKAAAWQKVSERAGISLFDMPGGTKVITMPQVEDSKGFEFNRLWMGIAAAIVMALSITIFLLNRGPEQIIASNTEGTKEFLLPDSSRVVLKDVSTLAYNSDYGKKHRDIIISGTAYLDVKHNSSLPFVISTDKGRIEVLGTAFVVEETTEGLELTVERGRVQLSSLTDPDISVVLEQNEKAILLNNDSIDLRPIDNLNNLYWATKELSYRQTHLNIVFGELSQIFDVPIDFNEDDVANCRISGIFRDENLESIISNMALSMDFEYTFDGTTYHISSNGCESN